MAEKISVTAVLALLIFVAVLSVIATTYILTALGFVNFSPQTSTATGTVTVNIYIPNETATSGVVAVNVVTPDTATDIGAT